MLKDKVVQQTCFQVVEKFSNWSKSICWKCPFVEPS